MCRAKLALFYVRLAVIVLLFGAVAFIALRSVYNDHTLSYAKLNAPTVSEKKTLRKNDDAWVIDPRRWLQTQDLTVIGTIPCRWITVDGLTFPICIYQQDNDNYVSGAVLNGKVFEQDVVERVIRFLRRHFPDDKAQLVDIGANLGSYALPVSRFASVVAVEPNWETMSRLAMSVALGNLDENMTLAYTAVSDKRVMLNMVYNPTNRGGTMMMANASCTQLAHLPGTVLRCLERPVKAILLDDLLPLVKHQRAVLKVDVEGFEVNVFTEETASVFFKSIDVPLILLEWGMILLMIKQNQQYAPEIERLLSFFKQRDYLVFDQENRPLSAEWRGWPNNILLKKKFFANETL